MRCATGDVKRHTSVRHDQVVRAMAHALDSLDARVKIATHLRGTPKERFPRYWVRLLGASDEGLRNEGLRIDGGQRTSHYNKKACQYVVCRSLFGAMRETPGECGEIYGDSSTMGHWQILCDRLRRNGEETEPGFVAGPRKSVRELRRFDGLRRVRRPLEWFKRSIEYASTVVTMHGMLATSSNPNANLQRCHVAFPSTT